MWKNEAFFTFYSSVHKFFFKLCWYNNTERFYLRFVDFSTFKSFNFAYKFNDFKIWFFLLKISCIHTETDIRESIRKLFIKVFCCFPIYNVYITPTSGSVSVGLIYTKMQKQQNWKWKGHKADIFTCQSKNVKCEK